MFREQPLLFSNVYLFLAATTALSLLSCTSSDDGDPGPTTSFVREGLPLLPVPTPRITPEFATEDSIARIARGTLVGHLNRVRLAAKTAETTAAALNRGGWDATSPGCRTREAGAPTDTTCSYLTYVCATATGFDWHEIANGPCIPGEALFVDWIRFAGSTSADGSTGTMETFVRNLTRVEESWTWSMDPSRTVQEWAFYGGPATEANLRGRLRWDQSGPDLAHAEFLWDPTHEWRAEFASDGKEGGMDVFERVRHSAGWARREEIRWRPAHGSWRLYDLGGSLVEERTW